MKTTSNISLISVVLPTYNRLDALQRAVESFFSQTDKRFEFIIVDDGSTDGTGGYLQDLQSKGLIRLIRQQNAGPAAARNAGIAIAQGEVIAFTDDDCVVPPDWIERIHAAFVDETIGIVGGRVENAVEQNIYASVSQEMINHLVEENARQGPSTSFLTSNNIAYRTVLLRRCGGFDIRFITPGGEERALNLKLIASGAKSLYDENIVVKHYHTMTLRTFIRQHLNYGSGSKILRSIIAREYPDLKLPVSLAHYVRLMMRFLRSNGGVRKVILFIIGQMAVTVGYFYHNGKRDVSIQ